MHGSSLVPTTGIVTFRHPPSSSASESDDEKSTSEEDSGSSDSLTKPVRKTLDQTWRWGIWQSRDARRAATSYTDQLLSHMPESFRFQSEVLDRRNIVLGAKLLLALNLATFSLSYVVIAILLASFHKPDSCNEICETNHGCGVLYLLVEINGGLIRVLVDVLYLLVVVPVLFYCFWGTSHKDTNMRRRIYLVVLGIIYVKIWVMYMYPVGAHCSLAERALNCGGIGREDQILDLIPECRNFGFFLLNKDMALVMLSPAVVPECSKMRGFLWSLTGLYYVVAMLAIHQLVKTPNQRYHAYFDVIIGLVFLFLVNEAARHRKWYMERADQVSFVLALRQKKASQSMFQILTFMLPSFMVTRILKSPEKTISESVKRASILFIKINDFDDMIQRLSPSHLLEKLNSIFSRLDSYCSSRNVTKIETVAEEYMCAVGIVPSDQAFELEDESQGHRTLMRLVQLAGDVLDYSRNLTTADQVVFQMGIHTGPVIAGVVGAKLPRFRLFGDTVNTAARMMQKGLPNEVQFGEETRRELPVGVVYRSRGPVEMKGKGMINTYLLVHEYRSQGGPRTSYKSPRRLHVHGTVQLAAAMVQSGGGSTMVEGPDDAEMFEDALVNAESEEFTCGQGSDWLDLKGRDEAAKQFRAWYYENHLFKKLVKRLDKQLIFIFVLTFIETIYLADSLGRSSQLPMWHEYGYGKWSDDQCAFLVSMKIDDSVEGGPVEGCKSQCWAYGPCTAIEFHQNSNLCILRQCPDEPPEVLIVDNASVCFWWSQSQGTATSTSTATYDQAVLAWDKATRQRKLSMFVISRAVAFGIVFAWRVIVSCTSCVVAHARCSEWLAAISCCILSVILFLSYEVMPEQFTADTKHEIDEIIPIDFPISGVSRNITRLVSFPVYMMCITAFPFRFFPCFIFLLGCLLIIIVESGVISDKCYLLPTYGDLWYFLMFNILRQFYSYQEEKLLRQQYANGRAVECVMSRVQSILDTMMPAQAGATWGPIEVVKEIAEHPDSPLPSHKYHMATIAQSDLVGFTEMSSQRTPEEVVKVIEELFNIFDDLTDKYGVYKIETVGDAYIAGMAEQPLTPRHSVVTVLRFALAMVEKTEAWSRRQGEDLRLRVGVHCGECVGGVVGKDMQRYHLFGSICSVLDILEGTSSPGSVQISTACFEAMQQELGAMWGEKVLEMLNCRVVGRTEENLRTSKGEIHFYSEVCGLTYFLLPLLRHRTH